MRKLRSPSDVDRDYRDFYRIFDETFLGIFPDFVEQVNALLEEPARFPVRADRTLPTELRILAVMRLGITDSGRIAGFLNCASATVYTYRTKLRNSALGSRSDFENPDQAYRPLRGSVPGSRRASEGILPSLYRAFDGLLPSSDGFRRVFAGSCRGAPRVRCYPCPRPGTLPAFTLPRARSS